MTHRVIQWHAKINSGIRRSFRYRLKVSCSGLWSIYQFVDSASVGLGWQMVGYCTEDYCRAFRVADTQVWPLRSFDTVSVRVTRVQGGDFAIPVTLDEGT